MLFMDSPRVEGSIENRISNVSLLCIPSEMFGINTTAVVADERCMASVSVQFIRWFTVRQQTRDMMSVVCLSLEPESTVARSEICERPLYTSFWPRFRNQLLKPSKRFTSWNTFSNFVATVSSPSGIMFRAHTPCKEGKTAVINRTNHMQSIAGV